MTEQLCPACGCSIEGEAYEQDGLEYCCKPCAASDGPWQRGCCQSAEEEKEDQIKNTECGFGIEIQGFLCPTI